MDRFKLAAASCLISMDAFTAEVAKLAEIPETARSAWTMVHNPVPGTKEVQDLTNSTHPTKFGTPLQTRIRKMRERLSEKVGFATSMYSGPLSYGHFQQASGIPPFVQPPVATKSSQERMAEGLQKTMAKRAEAGGFTIRGPGPASPNSLKATGTNPMKQFKQSQRIGVVPPTIPSGKSISQIAKPKGFGEPMAGAIKSTPSYV